MTDAELLAALEDCSLPESAFRHATHVRVAYLYLRSGSFTEAIARMSKSLRIYAAAHGKSDLYHETITIAFLAVINERIATQGDGGDWEGFAAANPDLFDKRLLRHYYRPGTLESAVARRTFVLGSFSPAPYAD